VHGAGFQQDEFIFASYLIRGRIPNDRMLPIFLREYLLGWEGRRRLRAQCKTSAGQYNINTQNLGAIGVLTPPREFQRAFAERVKAVDVLKRSHQTAFVKANTLFASLQHRAFRGEL